MKPKYFILYFILLLLSNCTQSDNPSENKEIQKLENNSSKYELNIQDACSFDVDLKNKKLYAFDSDIEAEDAVNKIMKLTGLPSNFIIKAANVPNATAVILCPEPNNCQRYILYNQEFLESIKDETKTDFSELAIICHEIGHHLSGHTITDTGNRFDIELEADKFAGFMLYKLGATIEEAKSAFLNLPENGSESHPPRFARLTAVSNGWYDAKRNGETISKLDLGHSNSGSTNGTKSTEVDNSSSKMNNFLNQEKMSIKQFFEKNNKMEWKGETFYFHNTVVTTVDRFWTCWNSKYFSFCPHEAHISRYNDWTIEEKSVWIGYKSWRKKSKYRITFYLNFMAVDDSGEEIGLKERSCYSFYDSNFNFLDFNTKEDGDNLGN